VQRQVSITVVQTEAGELFTFGIGGDGKLGHGGTQNECEPRLVEALVGKKVIGLSVGFGHTAVWTEEGELVTFGEGSWGKLGHGGTGDEGVPRLVEALVGKKVVGASADCDHTVLWTEAGEFYWDAHPSSVHTAVCPKPTDTPDRVRWRYGLLQTRGALTAKINKSTPHLPPLSLYLPFINYRRVWPRS